MLQRADGTRLGGGYRLGSANHAPPYEAQRSTLPPAVDLRPFMTAVENQGSTSSCVANAVAGAYEYLAKRHLQVDGFDVSRLFVYYNARKRAQIEGEDAGSQIIDAVESLRAEGACRESTWPFEESLVLEEPSPDAYGEASQFLIEDVAAVPTELDAWKGALADGYPIIFGLKLYASFDRHKKPGSVPPPTNSESSRESHGGHAMLCVGYSDKDRVFIVRNSWGDAWGDKGYCYIPYSYAMNAEHNFGDSWIVKRLDNVPVDGHTSETDEGVLPADDALLASLSDEQYEVFLDALGDVPFETRIAALLLQAAAADDELGEAEIAQAVPYLERLLQAAGANYDAEALLGFALERLEADPEIVSHTVEVFRECLPPETLAAIANEVLGVIEADGVAEGEASFHDELVTAWQLA